MAAVYEGGCSCGEVRYRLQGRPMVVNCCHCTYCQRETGSSFALNAFYESDRVIVTTDTPLEVTSLSTASGKPQRLHRCPSCKIVIYALYSDNGDYLRVVKVGTLDQRDDFPADLHIYTSTKQPWVKLDDKPSFAGPGKNKEVWSKESLARMGKVVEKMKADRQARQKAQAGATGKAKL